MYETATIVVSIILILIISYIISPFFPRKQTREVVRERRVEVPVYKTLDDVPPLRSTHVGQEYTGVTVSVVKSLTYSGHKSNYDFISISQGKALGSTRSIMIKPSIVPELIVALQAVKNESDRITLKVEQAEA